MVNPKVGLTGVPRSGKTETVKKLIESLKKEGYTIGGVIMENIVQKNQIVGIELVNVATGEKVKIIGPEFESKQKYEGMGINIEGIETVGVRAIEQALESADIIVIDEIGKFDFESPKFKEIVKKALDSRKIMIITLHKKSRAVLLQDIRRRDDIRILEVTSLNRGLMPLKIMNYIKNET